MKCHSLVVVLSIAASAMPLYATDVDLAARATNEFGLDLFRQIATGQENVCLSPYSIQNALAMTFAGAEGDTRSEMARVLHFPEEGEAIHPSFGALRRDLLDMSRKTEKIVQESKTRGGPSEPIRLSMANRLFAQRGYDFRDVFRQIVDQFYNAPVETLEFHRSPEYARQHINKWVSDQTLDRIHDLIPPNGLTPDTRLVLANAIYLKAPWTEPFQTASTRPGPFHVRGGAAVDVPMMSGRAHYGYMKGKGFVAVALPYVGGDLHFLVVVPETIDGLRALQSNLSADTLAECAKLVPEEVELTLPKFKLQPPTVELKDQLKALGMKTAFDDPQGSANFDRMALRKPNDYLAISDVFHKTFIAVDENGTEAAAATATVMMEVASAMRKPKEPIQVTVDRPFFYAIQHVPSGACLFIGRVTDPR